MIRYHDDASLRLIPHGEGVEIQVLVAGARDVAHYTSWADVPWGELVAEATARGELTMLVARDMGATTTQPALDNRRPAHYGGSPRGPAA